MLILSLPRFGGGFELMKKLVATRMEFGPFLESGLQYVTVPSASSVCISVPFLASAQSHRAYVPYVVGFMMSAAAMGGGGALRRSIDFGRASVLKRLEVGTNRKDLFYYLVRQYIICPTCSLH